MKGCKVSEVPEWLMFTKLLLDSPESEVFHDTPLGPLVILELLDHSAHKMKIKGSWIKFVRWTAQRIIILKNFPAGQPSLLMLENT